MRPVLGANASAAAAVRAAAALFEAVHPTFFEALY